jgi:hypothetical protein
MFYWRNGGIGNLIPIGLMSRYIVAVPWTSSFDLCETEK